MNKKMKHVFSQYSIEFTNLSRAENNSIKSYKKQHSTFLLGIIAISIKSDSNHNNNNQIESNKFKLFLNFTIKTLEYK